MSADPIVTFTYEGQAVIDLLEQLAERSQDLTQAMTLIGEEGLLQTDLNFELERDPDGIAWRPLSPYTISWKRENSRILKILQSTGRLRASITYSADKMSVTIGTNVSYAADHQLGINGVSQRKFLGIGAEFESSIIQILEEHILLGDVG